MKRATPFLLILVLAAGGCDLLGPDESAHRVVGILKWAPAESAMTEAGDATFDAVDQVHIAAPDTVTAGTPFDVEVRTVGADACWRPDGEDVTVSGTTASVTPYDLVVTEIDGEPAVCAAVLVPLRHSLTLVLQEAGEGRVTVSGRVVTRGDESTATPLEESVPVTILPAGS